MRFFSFLALTLLFAAPAFAQNNDMRAVMSRLDQLQRQMDTVSRQVYSGNPPPEAVSRAVPSDTSSMAAAFDDRMNSMEGSMRQINNRLDEQDYAIGQLKQQFDLFKSDLEMRLKEVGSNRAVSNVADNATAPPPPFPDTPVEPRKTAAVAPADLPSDDTGAVKDLPTDNAAALYDASFQFLREQKYPEAQAGFKEFLSRYSSDTLAGNAQYWLGETYYVQGNYPEAAKVFAQGYKKYPKSSKAPDNLLKLGLALSQAGKKQDACVTFQQLGTQYSNAAAVIKQRAEDEAKKLNCGAPVQG